MNQKNDINDDFYKNFTTDNSCDNNEINIYSDYEQNKETNNQDEEKEP